MREYVNEVLTPVECALLADTVGYLEFTDPRLVKVLAAVWSVTEVDLREPSYVRVEARPGGHPWHMDTGSSAHMSWCRYGARILLDPDDSFSGGGFYFRDRPSDAIFGHGGLLIYSNDEPANEHLVTRSRGARRVLLLFMGERDG